MRLGRRRRWLLIAGGTLLVTAIALTVLGRWYLKRQILAQLAAFNGGPVAVERVELGFQQQRVFGVKLGERDDGDLSWLTAGTAVLEISLWEAVQGVTMPRHIAVDDVAVSLRFNEQGNLLTGLPPLADSDGEVPAASIAVTDGRLEIDWGGRQTLAVRVDPLRVRSADGRIRIEANVGDLLSDDWSLTCEVDERSLKTTWQSTADAATLGKADLAALPLPDRVVAALPEFDVGAAVSFSGEYDPSGELHYRLQCRQLNWKTTLADDVELTGGRGSLVVEDGVLTVPDLTAEFSGGRVALSGSLNYGQAPKRGQWRLRIRDMVLADMPASWRVPDDLRGVFSGSAQLQTVSLDEGFRLTGDAEGSVQDAVILGLPAEPIRVALTLRPPDGQADAPAAAPYSGEVRLDVALKEIELARALARFDADTRQNWPRLEGRLSLSGSVRAPLESATDAASYVGEGRVVLTGGNLAGIRVDDLQTKLVYTASTLQVQEVQLRLADGGTARGQLQVGLADSSAPVVATAQFTDIPGKLATDFFPQSGVAAGAASGRVRLTFARQNWDQIAAWEADGELRVKRLAARGIEIAEFGSPFRLHQGSLQLDGAAARWKEAVVGGDLKLALSQPYSFECRLKVTAIDAAKVIEESSVMWPVSVAASVTVDGSVRGNLEPLSWQASGSMASAKVMLDDWSASSATCPWRADAAALTVTNARADVLDGQVQLNAVVPWTAGGNVQLRGSFRNLDSGQLAERLGLGSTLSLAGRLAGDFTVAHLEDTARLEGSMRFAGARAAARGVDVEQLGGEFDYRQGTLTMNVNGDALGGKVGFQGQGRAPQSDLSKLQIDGQLAVEGANLVQVVTGTPYRETLRPLRGRAAGQLQVRLTGPDFAPTARGRVTLTDLRWDSRPLTGLLEADVALNASKLRVSNIAARLADGTVNGEVSLDLDRPDSGEFTIEADRLSLRQLPRSWRGDWTGSMAGILQGRLGTRWQGSGHLRLTGGKLAGVPVHSMRAPVDWSFSPRSRSIWARFRTSAARVAGGRLSGEAEIRWSGRLDLRGKFKMTAADMRLLARAAPQVRDQLSGRLDCEFRFQGNNVRSVDQLTGTFEGKLTQSQAMMLPVLDSLTDELGMGGRSSETFASTSAKGRFRRGVLSLDHMTMESSNASIYVEGNMTSRGRLDLDVTADTRGAVAVGVAIGILRPTDFLRRRLIFLHVGGSLRSPTVHPRTAEFIEQEIILFFLPFLIL